jgi:aryl-alcohol dehydrogenase-like predicted oxidoreductase
VSDKKSFSPDCLELGLGLLSIGRVWGVGQIEPPSDEDVQDLLHRALDLGIRVFDTAPAYAASEARFGRFLDQLDPARRKNLVVMTKTGEHWDCDRGASFVDHRRDALCRSIDRSLKLLGRIDVLQIHKATRDVVRDPAVMAALDHARASGISTFGASVSDLEASSAALETGIYQTLQFPLNLASQTFAPLLPTLRAAGVAAIVNRPFAMGGLVSNSAGNGADARAAFGFIAEHVHRGVVLTGTGKAAHLAANVEAFRRSEALAGGLV